MQNPFQTHFANHRAILLGQSECGAGRAWEESGFCTSRLDKKKQLRMASHAWSCMHLLREIIGTKNPLGQFSTQLFPNKVLVKPALCRLLPREVRARGSGLLGSSFISATDSLWDLGKVTSPLCASPSRPIKWDQQGSINEHVKRAATSFLTILWNSK